MTQNEYRIARENILAIIEKAKNDLKTLNQEFIEQNRKFNDGDKVLITTPEYECYGITFPKKQRVAFVGSYGVSFGDVCINLFKAKKDGSPSKKSDFLCSNETIELYND